MKKVNNFQKAKLSLKVLLSCCLFFLSDIAYNSVAYKKRAYLQYELLLAGITK